MPLDYDALDKASEEMEERAAGGAKNIVSVQKIPSGKSIIIRVLPPTESLKGFFYFEEKGHWINGVRYVSPSTFGGKDIIGEIVEKAKADKDPDVMSLLDAKEYNNRSGFYIPGLLCEVEFKGQKIKSVKVVDEEAKFIQVNSTVVRRLLKLFQSRIAQNGTDDRLADREQGMFIEIGKTGKGLNTEYTADVIPESWEMDEKYYEDIPDVVEFVREKMKPISELKEAINSYLEGKPSSKKRKSRDDDDDDDEDDRSTRNSRKRDDDDEDEKPRKKRSAREFLKDSEEE